ncbi:aminotransferase class IV [Brachybacterium sp. EF45031]|uniref:aminotransferase class IV n=1 Tax=Brachybacterium sillae TaxID=2810536 RepID=UPI00217E051F|nr:aminotransferase class IV [Brachybacterium sillae]MCS6712038.1 aminotransferase class IV [Brachybacterium sillae]
MVEPLVIDSYLVVDGRAQGLDLHEQRFAASVGELLGIGADEVRALRRRAEAVTPPQGRWFPRWEARPAGRADQAAPTADQAAPTADRVAPAALDVQVRPAPPRPDRAGLWITSDPDPRRRPRHKGPDLPALTDLRAHAETAGMTDALLRDADGHLLETDHSALVWWRDGALCLPDPTLPVLPSVTARRLVQAARSAGIAVRTERARWQDLAGCELWCVGALRGADLVTQVMGEENLLVTHASAHDRVTHWRAVLDGQVPAVSPEGS